MTTEHIYKCEKCGNGNVILTLKETKEWNQVNIKKCDNCKYQYHLKELLKIKN